MKRCLGAGDLVQRTIRLIERQIARFSLPSVTLLSLKRDPYLVLISCILSLRTQDKTTFEASQRIFRRADTPKKMLKIPVKQIAEIIYPVGFYRVKAKVIAGVSRRILRDFAGKVPDTLDDLLSFKGVGRKTANLVLGLGFNIPAICVDTHVHRISNRIGWVRTKSPEETEEALKRVFPRREWIALNTTLVTFGQHICRPVLPHCSVCSVRGRCLRIGVVKDH